MASSGPKHSFLEFYYDDEHDLVAESVYLAIAAKGIHRDVYGTSKVQIPDEILSLIPYGGPPVLVDRDLVLFDHFIMLEYLDERFPHPPLLPVYPVSRAQVRSDMFRIRFEWYHTLIDQIIRLTKKAELTKEEEEVLQKSRKELVEGLTVIATSGLSDSQFFKSESFSLLDCLLLPIIQNLKTKLGIEKSLFPSQQVDVYQKLQQYKDGLMQLDYVQLVYQNENTTP